MDMLRETATSSGEMTSHRAALSLGQVFIKAESYKTILTRSEKSQLPPKSKPPPAGGAPPTITSDIRLISWRPRGADSNTMQQLHALGLFVLMRLMCTSIFHVPCLQ